MRPRLSLATQIFALQLCVLAFTVIAGTVASVWLARQQLDEQYQDRALAVAETVAAMPDVRAAVVAQGGSTVVQPIAEAVRASSGASFIVVTDRNGIRLSHPNPALIGLSAIQPGEPAAALSGQTYTATETGSLGVSARGKAPVFDAGHQVIGMVSVGYPEVEVTAGLAGILPFAASYLVVALLLGFGASWLLARHLKRQTFGLEPVEIGSLLERREAMLHGIREGAVGLDRNGCVTLINDEARRLLALDEEVVGMPLEDVLRPSRLRDVLAGRIAGTDQLVLAGDRVLLANRMPVVVRGEVVGAVATLRDRTELQGLLRELQGAKGVTEALRAQVHEFSNRLHTIAGLVELGRPEEAIRLATEGVELHQELVERLVERIGDPQLCGLLLAKAAVASERAIELRLSDDSLLSEALDEAGDIITIVGNLVDNAFDAVRSNPPEAERWVDVAVRDDAGAIVIRVSDSGPGVDPVLADRIFDEGYTTKPAATGRRGLGLALVRQVVERLDGSVGVHDETGAVFTVRLPRVRGRGTTLAGIAVTAGPTDAAAPLHPAAPPAGTTAKATLAHPAAGEPAA